MSRKLKINIVLSSIALLLPPIAGIVLWDKFPDRVPIHWNAAGEVDGYGSRLFLVAGLSSIFIVMHLITALVTGASLKEKGEHTSAGMCIVLWLMPVISLCTSAFTYSAALGIYIDPSTVFPLIPCAVFLLTGLILRRYPEMKAINFPTVSIATRRFTGLLMMVSAAITAVLLLLKLYRFIIPVPVLLVVLSIVYHFRRGKYLG